MKTHKNKYAIDGNKLTALLKANGVTPKEASLEMGYSSGYFSNNIRDGYIYDVGKNFLELKYGIRLDAYIAEGARESSSNPSDTSSTIEHLLEEILKTNKAILQYIEDIQC